MRSNNLIPGTLFLLLALTVAVGSMACKTTKASGKGATENPKKKTPGETPPADTPPSAETETIEFSYSCEFPAGQYRLELVGDGDWELTGLGQAYSTEEIKVVGLGIEAVADIPEDQPNYAGTFRVVSFLYDHENGERKAEKATDYIEENSEKFGGLKELLVGFAAEKKMALIVISQKQGDVEPRKCTAEAAAKFVPKGDGDDEAWEITVAEPGGKGEAKHKVPKPKSSDPAPRNKPKAN